jgi:arginine deiminase
MKQGVNVYSEIGKLNRVFLHRLGKELEGLVPDNFERLLFDDIPYLDAAQYEHDCFADVLRENQVEVLYFADQAAVALADKDVRHRFIKEFIAESDVVSLHAREAIYLKDLSSETLIEKMISGVKKSDISLKTIATLSDIVAESYPYYTDPLPNLYFTRDPGACIGNGLNIHCMSTKARRRESLFLKYMHKYNKTLFPEGTPLWYDYAGPNNIEGGDILVLSPEIVAVGYSQRTSAEAIEIMAENLLKHSNSFKKVLVFEIPKCRAFMHLDTVFTMVDYDKFTIHPEIEDPLNIYEVTLGNDGRPAFKSSAGILVNILKHELKLPAVQLIRCGGNDKIAAQREQWSDGSNTLAIAPGVVITYDRNYVTNDLLDKSGVKVLTIPSSELSRGRGGPRCMSMPINRD